MKTVGVGVPDDPAVVCCEFTRRFGESADGTGRGVADAAPYTAYTDGVDKTGDLW